jgi:hypothetical protein
MLVDKKINSEKMLGTMVFVGLGVIAFFTFYGLSKMIKQAKEIEKKNG